MDHNVERMELEPQPTAVIRAHVAHDGIPDFLGGAFGEVMGALATQGLAPAGPPFARYDLTDDGFDIEAGFPASAPVMPTGRFEASELPGGSAIVVLHRGPYADVAAAYRAAEAWLLANECSSIGSPWEAYLDGPEVAEPRTIVHWPCRPR